MAKDKFMFFPNFKAMAEKLDDAMRLKFYDALTDYVFYDKEPDDPIISALLEAIKPSLDKVDGRQNNGGNHNPNGVNQHSKVGQSGQIRSKLVNSGQISSETKVETEDETETEVKEKELSDDNSKKKSINFDTTFEAGGQFWELLPEFRKLALTRYTEEEIHEFEKEHSCHENLVKVCLNDIKKQEQPKPKKKQVEVVNYGQYEYLHPQMDKWIDYKKSRGERYKTEQSLMVCAKKLHELSGGSASVADQIIEQSIANNWAGIFALKQSNNQPQRKNWSNYVGEGSFLKDPKDDPFYADIFNKKD